MKKSILLLVATIIIGCCSIANANITTLGTIEYESFMQTSISSPTEVNFTLIYSTMDESVLTIDKIGFIPSLNETKFVFTSNAVEPMWWWFNLSDELFIFQDKNTLELYKIYIDYSAVEVPPIPSDIELGDLQMLFNQTFDKLQLAMTNLTNLSNQHNLTIDELVQLRYYYNNTFDNYTNLGYDYNKTVLEIVKLNSNLTNMTNRYMDKYDAYNRTFANASLYGDFYNSMLSNLNAFWFENEYGSNKYRTINSYEDEIEEQKNVLGLFPAYLIFAVLIVLIFTLLLARRMWGKRKKSTIEIEATEGYTKESRKVDNFVARLFKKIPNPFTGKTSAQNPAVLKNPPDASENPQNVQNTTPTESHDNLLDNIDKMFQKNIEPMNNRLEFIEVQVKKHDKIISNIDKLIKKPQPKKVGT